jgi:hypothetical protein
MRRITLAATLTVAAAAPGTARAHLTHHQAVAYGRAYAHVVRVFGRRAAGCKLIGRRATCRRSTDRRVLRSTAVLHRALYVVAPAPPAPASYARPTNYAAPVPVATSPAYNGGYSIPAGIVQCESHGDWSAVNPATGAGGAYQILPSTWDQYGGGPGGPAGSSPAEQSRVAALIYAAVGGSAWTC